jgi:hypothetical protein
MRQFGGAGRSVVRRRCSGFLLGLALALAACSGADDPSAVVGGGAGSTSPSTTPTATTSTPQPSGTGAASASSGPSGRSTSAGTGGAVGTSTTPSSHPTAGSTVAADGDRMTWAELFPHRRELAGRTVDVDARVFFLTRCPPPGGGAGECQLTGFATDPARTEFDERHRDTGIPLSEAGTAVTCAESAAAGGACQGWRQATTYRLVARVQQQVLGGRTTEYVELDVLEKSAR